METENSKKKTSIDKVTDFIENKVAPPLVRLSQVRYLEALQKTFIAIMPYMILGATATLVNNLPGLFAEKTGLNLPAVSAALTSIIKPIQPTLLQIVFVTINLLALLTVVLNGYYLGSFYNKKDSDVNPVASAIVAMVSFLCFINFTNLSKNFDWPSYILGAPSMFGGIIISILAVEIYRWFIHKKITIKMPESVPPMIADAFTSIIPVSIIVILFSVVGAGFKNFDFLQMLNKWTSYLVIGGSGFAAQFLGFFLDRILWFVGLHGSNIVSSVMQPIWTSMITSNINAFAAGKPIPYMFTNEWINSYVRISVFPIALLCCMSKVKRYRVLGKLALPGTIFNIAEPIMYGLPIVLNPILFIPWVLGFSFTFILNAILATIGLIPPIAAMVVWTMPAPLAAFIGSGFKFSGLIFSLLNYVLIFLIFLPFFKVLEKQELKKEKEESEQSQE
jgi:PTS system cellobiose-specific IIC component